MATHQGQTNVKGAMMVKEPDLYDVVMLNDDFTTMDFVVMVLKQVFFHTDTEAEQIMMTIHKKGMCVVGTYSLDIALSKQTKATKMAREAGFPLRLKTQRH